jgi:putative intracellular protease/amidase
LDGDYFWIVRGLPARQQKPFWICFIYGGEFELGFSWISDEQHSRYGRQHNIFCFAFARIVKLEQRERMKIAIVVFDKFTDVDLWLMWDLLNRVRAADWSVKILGERETHVSATEMSVATHGRIEEANNADAVLFVSGQGTREKMHDVAWLDRFNLKPEKQLIGSICSGSLILAALGLLEGKTATTYPTSKAALENLGIKVVEKPFVTNGNVATAGGCLALQYLCGWTIENLAGKDWRDLVLKSVQPVGEGLFFEDAQHLTKLYVPVKAVVA